MTQTAPADIPATSFTRPRPLLWPMLISAVGGAAGGLNRLSLYAVYEWISIPWGQTLAAALVGAAVGAAAAAVLQVVTARVVRHLGPDVQKRFARLDTLAYLPVLVTLAGAWGVRPWPAVAVLLVVLGLKALLLWSTLSRPRRQDVLASQGWLAFLFLISGFAALIYQIVWQRTLFAAYGVNIESITIIVSLFMFGLGLGSLAGGTVVKRLPRAALGLFLTCEICIGLFGVVSLPLIAHVSTATLHAPVTVVSLVIFALLALPTFLMGATLPVLVGFVHQHYHNVGKSVGLLYSINTIGSTIACFLTADLLFVWMGQQASVLVAASSNAVVAVLVWQYARRLMRRRDAARLEDGRDESRLGHAEQAPPLNSGESPTEIRNPQSAIRNGSAPDLAPATDPLRRIDRVLIVLFAAATGYISLTQEMVWMRVVGYITGGRPTVFAHVLGFFLIGVAAGAWYGKRLCEHGLSGRAPARTLARLLLISGVFYFFSIWATVKLYAVWALAGRTLMHLIVAAVSFLLGGVFPILCHFAARGGRNAGATVGKLYLANIIGCTLGPLLTSFVLMDILTTQQIVLGVSLATLALGVVALLWAAPPLPVKGLAVAGVAAAVLVWRYPVAYENLIGRMQGMDAHLVRYVVQDRSGIIMAKKDPKGDIIYGGGMYDGRMHIDPVNDTNRISRCYMIAALHPNPTRALEVGLSGGSWARVMADYGAIKDLQIVEIGHGYQKIIRNYDPHKTLLTEAKVRIHIDDGRRWLNRHPDEKFDLILQNTTYHWRDHITNLVSKEYLELCKKHLKPGGVIHYNTTGSEDVAYTTAQVFKHVIRYDSFVAGSDSPFTVTPEQARANFAKFMRGDKPTFDVPGGQEAIEKLLKHVPLKDVGDEYRRRTDLYCITDDNMASEFKRFRLRNPKRAWWRALK